MNLVNGKAPVANPDETDDLSVSARVYDAIKQRILENHLRPGNKLTHQELAAMLRVSRTPVRVALERLYQEGYVVHHRNRGFFVAEIDETEAREILGLREALEVFALRSAVTQGRNVDVAGLEAINRRYRQAVEDGATKQRMVIDREFHLTLAAACGNRHLVQALGAIFERLILKVRVDGYRTLRGKEAYQEHVEIIRALRKSDYAAAEAGLGSHLSAAQSRLLEQLDVLEDMRTVSATGLARKGGAFLPG